MRDYADLIKRLRNRSLGVGIPTVSGDSTSKLLAEAADALARAEDKWNWQPINTAPKDGTVIMLYVPGFDSSRHCREAGPDITFGYYLTKVNWIYRKGWLSLETKDEPDYEGGTYQTKINLGDAPTHWMPVPDKPSE